MPIIGQIDCRAMTWPRVKGEILDPSPPRKAVLRCEINNRNLNSFAKLSNMSRRPADQFDYVFAKPSEPNKGTSYKYAWGRGTWRLPPDVKPLRVMLGVSFWLSLAAFPVFVWPYLRGPKSEAEKGPPNIYAVIKEKNREDRMRWIQSVDMPPR